MRKIYQYDDLEKEPDGAYDGALQGLVENSEGNLVSSLGEDGYHYPVLDFDFPCRLVPSRTEGCYHLYIDKNLTVAEYEHLLRGLHKAKLIEDGIWNQWRYSLKTFVRREGTFEPHSRSLKEKLAAKLKVQVENIKKKYSAIKVTDDEPVAQVYIPPTMRAVDVNIDLDTVLAAYRRNLENPVWTTWTTTNTNHTNDLQILAEEYRLIERIHGIPVGDNREA